MEREERFWRAIVQVLVVWSILPFFASSAAVAVLVFRWIVAMK